MAQEQISQPGAQSLSIFALYLSTLKKSLRFSGTATRTEAIAFLLMSAVIVMAFLAGFVLLASGPGALGWPALACLACAGVCAVALLPALLAVTARRCHAIGRTGLWCLLWILVAGSAALAYVPGVADIARWQTWEMICWGSGLLLFCFMTAPAKAPAPKAEPVKAAPPKASAAKDGK